MDFDWKRPSTLHALTEDYRCKRTPANYEFLTLQTALHCFERQRSHAIPRHNRHKLRFRLVLPGRQGNVPNGARKEVTRVRKFLKWLDRFWFKLKIELETGFNKHLDR